MGRHSPLDKIKKNNSKNKNKNKGKRYLVNHRSLELIANRKYMNKRRIKAF